MPRPAFYKRPDLDSMQTRLNFHTPNSSVPSPPLLARPHEALLGLGHRRRTLHSPAPPKPAVGQGKRSSGPSKRRRRRSQSDSSMEVFQGKSRSLCSAPVPKEKQGIIKCTECRTPCFGIAHARRRRRGVKVDATHKQMERLDASARASPVRKLRRRTTCRHPTTAATHNSNTTDNHPRAQRTAAHTSMTMYTLLSAAGNGACRRGTPQPFHPPPQYVTI